MCMARHKHCSWPLKQICRGINLTQHYKVRKGHAASSKGWGTKMRSCERCVSATRPAWHSSAKRGDLPHPRHGPICCGMQLKVCVSHKVWKTKIKKLLHVVCSPKSKRHWGNMKIHFVIPPGQQGYTMK